MRTHSFDPKSHPLARIALIGILALIASPWAPSSAEAQKKRGTITVTRDGDTTRVKEITIDDEGIRIIGGDKKVEIDGPTVTGEIDLNRDYPHRRVIRIEGGDSLRSIVIDTRGDNEIVQFFHDAHVEKGEVAGTVVALFGNVRNDGIITGDCVSILGSIVMGDSAVIQGDAVSVGGSIDDAGPASRIDGETVSIGFLPFSPVAVPGAFGLVVFGVLAFFLFVGLAALTARLFPERLLRISETISRRTFLSLVLGLLSIPLAAVVCLLLLVTVVGIPLAIILPFLFVLAAFVGYTASAYVLGTKLLGRSLNGSSGLIAPILAGTAFVTLFYLVGVPFLSGSGFARVIGVGFIALWLLIGTVCWKIGFGALMLSRLGQGPRSPESQWYPASSTPPPSAPMPPAEPRMSAPPAPPPLS